MISARVLRSGEADVVALDDVDQGVQLELETVRAREREDALDVRAPAARDERGERLVVTLEPGGRGGLLEAGGLRAGVPEGVPLAARHRQRLARVQGDDAAAHLHGERTLHTLQDE